MKEYKFKAIIQKNSDMNAGYIIFPYDIKKEFGKGRVKVHVAVDASIKSVVENKLVKPYK